MFDNNIMVNWLLTTPDSAIAVKYVDLLEESNNSTHPTKKRPSPRCRLSHEESNRLDKAKHGLKGRRKEESYKACNYESKQKALMRSKKKEDVFDDITMGDVFDLIEKEREENYFLIIRELASELDRLEKEVKAALQERDYYLAMAEMASDTFEAIKKEYNHVKYEYYMM